MLDRMSSYTLEPVGFIRSTLKRREEAPRQGAEGAPDAWLESFTRAHRHARIRSDCIR